MASTRGIDFANLSLKDALDLAILVEDEAQERYEDFAAQMDQHRTPEAAKFFRYMVENEAKHGRELLARRVRLFEDSPRVVTRTMIFDIEAPDFDAARAFMSPRKAMEAALASEEKAYDFFVAALPTLKDADVRALFEELRDEELEHQDLVKAELAKLPPDSHLSDDDFVDEPAAQ
jgi:rubrerythrin